MRKQSKDFYPPRPSSAAIFLMNALLPFILKKWCGVEEISIPETDIERLRVFSSARCIIAPNHPSRVEPAIVADLAKRVGKQFYFISAVENFDSFGPQLLQSLGAYSITRGTPDRKSLAATRSLLAEQDKQVVLFPEGEVYHHNDLMLPLNPGVAQIGFWALQDLAKLGKPSTLPIVPIAVKYKFLDGVSTYINRRVVRLEHALGIKVATGNLRERVLKVGTTIVDTLEKRYKLPTDGALSERIQRIRQTIIQRGLVIMSVDSKILEQPMAEQMRALFNAVREFKSEMNQADSEYELRIAAQTIVQAQLVIDDLNRVSDSILTSGQYVTSHPTYERLGDLLGRMEDEVFGKHVRYPRRVAIVRVAEPLDLGTMAEEYSKNKRASVSAATAEIASRIAGMLHELSDEGSPIPESDWPRVEMAENNIA